MINKWIPGRDGRAMMKLNEREYALKWALI
jgi:hypothetical protein